MRYNCRACGRLVFGDPQAHALFQCSGQNIDNNRKKGKQQSKSIGDFAGMNKQPQACT